MIVILFHWYLALDVSICRRYEQTEVQRLNLFFVFCCSQATVNLNKRQHHFYYYYYYYDYFRALMISYFDVAKMDRGRGGVRYFRIQLDRFCILDYKKKEKHMTSLL